METSQSIAICKCIFRILIENSKSLKVLPCHKLQNHDTKFQTVSENLNQYRHEFRLNTAEPSTITKRPESTRKSFSVLVCRGWKRRLLSTCSSHTAERGGESQSIQISLFRLVAYWLLNCIERRETKILYVVSTIAKSLT